MFFGLEVKSGANQAKPITIENTLKLSQAVLEPSKKDNGSKKGPVCLMAEYDKKQFILCVLDPNKSWQSPLDLVFEGGSQVKFFVRGTGTVHITGYENFDNLDDMSMSMSDEELESEEEEESGTVPVIEKKTPKAKTNGLKVPNKKNANNHSKDQPDDDESDDEDFDVDDLVYEDEDDMEDEDMSDEELDEVEDSSEDDSDV